MVDVHYYSKLDLWTFYDTYTIQFEEQTTHETSTRLRKVEKGKIYKTR